MRNLKIIKPDLIVALILILALILPVHTTAEESRNYMAEIITALTAGDVDHARILNAERNAKIDSMDYCPHPKIDTWDLWLVSKIVQQEAGSSWLTDEHQQLVASVLINRVNSPEFLDTVEKCVFQKGQYAGVTSSRFANLKPSERAVKNALIILERGSIAPSSVIFQSNYSRLGSGHYLVIRDRYLVTTYFAYSNNLELYEEG